jgi:LacI family transcriptional regulator
MEGYKKALCDHHIHCSDHDVIECSNDNASNYALLKKLLTERKRPDGIIASVEKLTTPVYLACKDLKLDIPKKIKVISFSNLDTALILDPPLTTISQPAFEMGQTAATILFKAIEKKNFQLKNEDIVIPSQLVEKESTR